MGINILILSAGRRVELVKAFKNAAKKLGIESLTVAVDMSASAPALYFADKHYIVPSVKDEDYINTLIRVINDNCICVVVPTIDTELLILSENKKLIEEKTKAKVLIADEHVIKICADKNKTQAFFEEYGFFAPRRIDPEEADKSSLNFPLFIKPANGSSSVNTFKLNNKKELDFFKDYIKNPIIQEYIEGEEYSVDVFCDFLSNPITIVPRRRIATRSGEILKGRIEKNREIIEDVKKMMKVLKPIGHVTVQCMRTRRGIEYIEINPRFGGGAPMSIVAGADSCESLYRLLMGQTLKYHEDYCDGLLFSRFDDSIMIPEE